MFDKTIFKAVACGCLVLATSRDFADLAREEFSFPENDVDTLAKKLTEFLVLSEEKHNIFVSTLSNAVKSHSLPVLVQRLKKEVN